MKIFGVIRASRLFSRAQRLVRDGSPDAALVLFERAGSLNPGMQLIRLHYALTLSDLGRTDEALSAMESLIRANSGKAIYHLFKGRILLDAGRTREAVSAFEDAARLDPRNRLVKSYQALASLEEGAAVSALQKLSGRRMSPSGHFRSRVLMAVEKALLAGRRPLRESEFLVYSRPIRVLRSWRLKRQAEQCLMRAISMLEQGQTSAARFQLRCAMELWPELPSGRFHLGALHILEGEFEAAIQELSRVPQKDKSYRASQTCLGIALYRCGNYEEALRVLPATGRSELTAYYRALAHMAQRDNPRARAEFARAVENDPSLLRDRFKELEALGRRSPQGKPAPDTP